jgi:cell wall-associated NlpC family hydrolase
VRRFSLRRLEAFVVTALLLSAGCGGRASVPHEPVLSAPKRKLALLGYSIQVGAFSNPHNAIRLAESLEAQGFSAYYFHHKSGLYKVRFGDFPNKEEARNRAEHLVANGTVDSYYIVSPEDYAAAKARVYGASTLRAEIVETAESFIGLPYQWGGSSAEEGFDCSGLTMAVYQLNGLSLPRSSREQFQDGAPVSREELARGDLVFFAISGGRKVSHVGIYTGDGRFIHAPGSGKTVRLDFLSNAYYRTRYIGGRTYL